MKTRKLKKSDIRFGAQVEGGRPYTEDFDQGKVVAFFSDGDVEVAWQSGITATQHYNPVAARLVESLAGVGGRLAWHP